MDEHTTVPSSRSDAEQRERIFGENLRRRRKELGMSQRDLADRMREQGHDWHHNTVRRSEQAARPVRVGELVSLAGILRVGLLDLLMSERDAKVDDLTTIMRSVKEAIADNETRLADAQNRAARADQEMQIIESVIKTLQDRIAEQQERLSRVREIYAYEHSRADAIESELDALHAELSRLNAELRNLL